MSPLKAIAVTASAFLLISIGGCTAVGDGRPDLKVTLPVADTARWRRCFDAPFPRWPAGDVSQEQVVGSYARSERLDTTKSDCGREAVSWVESVKRSFGK